LAASVAKGACPGLLRVAKLHISNNKGNTELKNSGRPKAFMTCIKFSKEKKKKKKEREEVESQVKVSR
jgi:hypothetical protein